MMQPIDLIKSYQDLYNPSYISHPANTDRGFSVVLAENDKSAKLKEVTVYNVPQKTILLSLHEYEKLKIGNYLKRILNADPGIFKSCDYLIITVMKEELYWVFVELKSEEFKKNYIIQQFKGASCFIEYCNAIIEHFFNPSIKSMTINTRYVLIAGKPLDKRRTKSIKYTKHTKPEDYYQRNVGKSIKSASVPFEALL